MLRFWDSLENTSPLCVVLPRTDTLAGRYLFLGRKRASNPSGAIKDFII